MVGKMEGSVTDETNEVGKAMDDPLVMVGKTDGSVTDGAIVPADTV